jgi:hypothetical protein
VLSAVRNIQDGEFDIDDGGMRLFARNPCNSCGEFRQCQITKSTRLKNQLTFILVVCSVETERDLVKHNYDFADLGMARNAG